MQKIIDFFNYNIMIGSDIVLTPKSMLIIIGVFVLTYLFLKVFRRIVFKTLNNDTKLKFRGILTFFQLFGLFDRNSYHLGQCWG